MRQHSQKPIDKQYCDSLAQRISNLKQTLVNKAFDLEKMPNKLPIDGPGPARATQWGHVALYIGYQAALMAREADYLNKCGGGPPPAVPATTLHNAPASFNIPAWLLFVGSAVTMGETIAPIVFAF